jgi:N-acetylmuramoyl-L-alanine amidase
MDAATPQGDGDFVVVDGDCMASIAFEHGFLPDTLWKLPQNADLKSGRADQRVLLPGDRVHIPEIRPRYEACQTDKKHVFVKKGVTETLRIVLLDEEGNPRPDLPYILTIDTDIVKSDVTPANGLIEAAIAPNARSGKLTVKGKEAEEVYALQLGGMDPISSATGVQGRLNNLGFYCGTVDGIMGHQTRGAISEFQASQNLTVTGQIDDDTRKALSRTHGF